MKTNQFKVGDKVTTKHGKGAVVFVDSIDARSYLVDLGPKFDGHDGTVGSRNTYTNKTETCLWFEDYELDLLAQGEEPNVEPKGAPFKVGDKIIYNGWYKIGLGDNPKGIIRRPMEESHTGEFVFVDFGRVGIYTHTGEGNGRFNKNNVILPEPTGFWVSVEDIKLDVEEPKQESKMDEPKVNQIDLIKVGGAVVRSAYGVQEVLFATTTKSSEVALVSLDGENFFPKEDLILTEDGRIVNQYVEYGDEVIAIYGIARCNGLAFHQDLDYCRELLWSKQK